MAGLNSINELIAKVSEASECLDKGIYMQSAVEDNSEKIIETNQEQLYLLGHNPLGISLGTYAPMTIQLKKQKGQPYDRVTLKDTGAFYNGFRVDANKDNFNITSDDSKTQTLLDRWGNIFGLTDENRSKITWSDIYPQLLLKLKSAIYG